MELSVIITPEQAARLIDDPESELILHYADGTKIYVRISEDDGYLGEDETLH